MATSEELRRGPERLRVSSWRGDAAVAHLVPVSSVPPPTTAMVRHACDVLAGRGYTSVLTGALTGAEQRGFLATGFEVREELHLLSRGLDDLPPPPRAPLRRARRGDRAAALEVDGRAFLPFWRLDPGGLDEALVATPSVRFRVAGHAGVAGYAICGRAGRRGYVQRLAVDPDSQGHGLGRALLVDGLRWLHRRRVERVVVNTQVGNEAALALYRALGFRQQPAGLAVLGRRLEERSLAR